jgi:hypothetical protein
MCVIANHTACGFVNVDPLSGGSVEKKKCMSRLFGGISHQVIIPIVGVEPEFNVYYSHLIRCIPSNMWNASDRRKNGFGPGWNGPGLAFY